jgi:hypothetical protein
VFAGYSRGGGLAQVAAYAMWKEGLVAQNKMKLVTFGSPRALNDNESDQIHGMFLQYRLVYGNDPVATMPPTWIGFEHFGIPVRYGGSFTRDEPHITNPLDIGDHSKYEEWLGVN